ncbi:glycosyltransferase family 1 protein [Vibrio parahaemolyticus]|nr:glycosyltransferase family 1 protein [Vibrio parahaemolyticus]
MFDFFKKVSKSEIYVMYVGDYSNQIGPPNSMIYLSHLLEKKYSVCMTSNLIKGDSSGDSMTNRSQNCVSRKNNFSIPFRKHLASIRFVALVISFNIKFLVARLVNPNIKFLITQPLLMPWYSFEMVYFIKRANLEISDIGKENKVFHYFESRFIKSKSFKLVYLVKQDYESGHPYSVIPNHFSNECFKVRVANESRIKMHSVGTWNKRKGAELLHELSDLLIEYSKERINIYGGLGNDERLNKLLKSEKFEYHGVISCPYNNFNVGDIFLSFSKVEGLQRSLVEALFMGCIIIAFPRPDSLSLKNYPGVFIVDPNNKYESLKTTLQQIYSLNYLELSELGLKNRSVAMNDFSEEGVLESWVKLLSR